MFSDNRANAICLISDWPGYDEINMAQTFAYFETNGDIEYYSQAGRKEK